MKNGTSLHAARLCLTFCWGLCSCLVSDTGLGDFTVFGLCTNSAWVHPMVTMLNGVPYETGAVSGLVGPAGPFLSSYDSNNASASPGALWTTGTSKINTNFQITGSGLLPYANIESGDLWLNPSPYQFSPSGWTNFWPNRSSGVGLVFTANFFVFEPPISVGSVYATGTGGFDDFFQVYIWHTNFQTTLPEYCQFWVRAVVNGVSTNFPVSQVLDSYIDYGITNIAPSIWWDNTSSNWYGEITSFPVVTPTGIAQFSQCYLDFTWDSNLVWQAQRISNPALYGQPYAPSGDNFFRNPDAWYTYSWSIDRSAVTVGNPYVISISNSVLVGLLRVMAPLYIK